MRGEMRFAFSASLYTDSRIAIGGPPRGQTDGLALAATSPYLGAMGMMSRFNPAGGVADFWNYVRRPQPYRGWILLASIAMSASTMTWLFFEKEYMPPPSPKVSYITTFEAGRTDAQIAASNAANQKRQDERDAADRERRDKAREVFRTLGRAAGMDVEKIERDAAEERAREEAANRARYALDRDTADSDGGSDDGSAPAAPAD